MAGVCVCVCVCVSSIPFRDKPMKIDCFWMRNMDLSAKFLDRMTEKFNVLLEAAVFVRKHVHHGLLVHKLTSQRPNVVGFAVEARECG